ncbi:MAG: hypothetical protein M3N00_05700 [Actinomycetota bacterium]|nr:hypothetical protein [Actinomycetota bacterium]
MDGAGLETSRLLHRAIYSNLPGREEDRINYFERMLADNPTGLLALANEYGKVERYEDEAVVLERYVANHEDERTVRQHTRR